MIGGIRLMQRNYKPREIKEKHKTHKASDLDRILDDIIKRNRLIYERLAEI
jgi:hypothetical protein